MSDEQAFKDHFSERSDLYARYRPEYPNELFEYLASLCVHRVRAWDCATGSGQAARALAYWFDEVIATDASGEQITAALPHTGVRYHIAPAEASGLDDDSVNLLTVGQALHWFDIERFFAEARRVLVKGGVLAAWCYERCNVSHECDAAVDELYSHILDGCWPPERELVQSGYAGIELPGEELAAPDFDMRLEWNVDDMLGYLGTWSACKRYKAANDDDPVARIAADLRAAWGPGPRPVRWPLSLRISRL